MAQMDTELEALLTEIRSCQLCAERLPLGPRPVLAASRKAAIHIVGQAPGTRVHETGVPFNDPSGDRLREWLGVSREAFYNTDYFAIIPMGFCFPGTHPSGRGDMPPDPVCAKTWRERLMAALPAPGLTVAIGQYAQAWHLGKARSKSLTETVRRFRDFAPALMPLPHPSPRNNIWMKKNPWFSEEVLPALRERVHALLPASALV